MNEDIAFMLESYVPVVCHQRHRHQMQGDYWYFEPPFPILDPKSAFQICHNVLLYNK